MSDSILTSIKKLIGIMEDNKDFDTDIIIHINTAFTRLRELGVGPKQGFRISGKTDTWDDFMNDDEIFDSVKTYVYLKVKIIFDPPLNSSVMQAYKETIKELEWTLNVDGDVSSLIQ